MIEITRPDEASLIIITDEPLPIGGVCIGCGERTEKKTRVELYAGDAGQEIMSIAGGQKSIVLPCCIKCQRPYQRSKYQAIGCMIGGFCLFAFMGPATEHTPIFVPAIIVFTAIMLILFAPIAVYARGRNIARVTEAEPKIGKFKLYGRLSPLSS